MPKATFKNTAPGARGLHDVDGALVMIEPGHQRTVEVNVDELADARAGKQFDIEVKDPGSAEDSQSGGGGDDGDGDGFDAEAFIDRTLDEISDDHLLALSPEQLAAVRAAEIDREKPRKGLTDRIDALTS